MSTPIAPSCHWNSSMSKTAIGTIRGLIGAPGAQLPATARWSESHVAPGSCAIRSPTPWLVGPDHRAVLGRQILADRDRVADAVADRVR